MRNKFIFIILVFFFTSNVFAQKNSGTLNNEKLRFGWANPQATGTIAEGTSVDTNGILKSPQTKLGDKWYKLTFSNNAFNMAIGEGGTGFNGGSIQGYGSSESGIITQTSKTYSYASNVDSIIYKGTTNVNGKLLEITQNYMLHDDQRYIEVITSIKNISGTDATNIRLWLGSRDDYVGNDDNPTKTAGNVTTEGFTPTNNELYDNAIRIESNLGEHNNVNAASLFYTTNNKASAMIHNNLSLGFSNVYNLDPSSAGSTALGDHSYGIYMPYGDLPNEATIEAKWYYVAADSLTLEAAAKAAAKAAIVRKIVNEDTQLTFESSDFVDSNNNTFTKIKISELPTNGLLKLDNVDVTVNQEVQSSDFSDLAYIPNVNFFGEDSFKWQGWSNEHSSYLSESTANIEINSVNDAPTIVGTPNTTVNEDSTYSFTPNGNDVDPNETLVYSIENKPSWATFDTSTGILSGTPTNDNVGKTSNIVITISDGTENTSLNAFDLEVVNTNDAPTISGTPNTNVDEDTAYSFTPTAQDVDTNTTFTFSIENKPSWATFDTATGTLSGTPANFDVGDSSNIKISVSDSIETVSLAPFNITVRNINDAPTISGNPNTEVDQDREYSFVPIANDVDFGDSLTFSIESKPSWATFDTTTGKLSGTPLVSDVGVYPNIIISVKDSSNVTASLNSFNIFVLSTLDTDNDGIRDSIDDDDDNDGLKDSFEGEIDTDGDGLPNLRDTDSDGDGKLDKNESITLDSDEDGTIDYLDGNDRGSDTPIVNDDGTETNTFRKTLGIGNKNVTKITTVPGKISGITENSDGSSTLTIADPNSNIKIENDGALDISTDRSNNTNKIKIENSGADIKLTDPDKNLIISTPTYIDENGNTCQYDLELLYNNNHITTKHYLNKGSNKEIITTVIMKVPNSSLEINDENQVIHIAEFTNSNSKEVKVIGAISCDGSVNTTTQLINNNHSFVAINKPGSTVIIEANGDVNTTTALEENKEDENKLQGLKFVIDSNSGDITTSKVLKDKDSEQVTFVPANTYLLGAKLKALGTTITEVDVDLTNTRLVTVDVKDSNNNTITSTTQIDNSITDGNISRTSNGENGSVTTEISLGGSTIVVNNKLDGKIQHIVNINGKTSQATSILEGASTNVSSTGVVTTYNDSSNSGVNTEVKTNTNGLTEHKLEKNGVTTQAISQILGTNTRIISDDNNEPKISTSVELVNATNIVEIQVDANANGSATHKLTIDGITNQATSQVPGATTQIKSNGEIETNVVLDSNTQSILKANPNGNSIHEVKGTNFTTQTTFEISGTTSVINNNKELESNLSRKSSMCANLSEYVIINVLTDINGKTRTKFNKYSCSDDSFIGSNTTANQAFEADNKIEIKQSGSEVEIKATTQLNENIQF